MQKKRAWDDTQLINRFKSAAKEMNITATDPAKLEDAAIRFAEDAKRRVLFYRIDRPLFDDELEAAYDEHDRCINEHLDRLRKENQ